MLQAFAAIDASDLILAEVSEKAIGVGIEIGYAVAKKKPVIYLRNANAAHSSTASGAAQYSIVYPNTEDLATGLRALMGSLII
jgi:2'-deoxynucleoside 5'-phosphate N-hydrolase